MRDLVLLAVTACTGCSFSGARVGPGDGAPGDARASIDAAPSIDGSVTLDAALQIDAGLPPKCSTNYPVVSPAGHHYKVLSNKSWDAASTGCADMGHLVKIDDDIENHFVAGLASGYFWIGLRDVTGNDVYTWTDGSALGFSGFAGAPPASADDCVNADSTAVWLPYDCTFQHAAICECE